MRQPRRSWASGAPSTATRKIARSALAADDTTPLELEQPEGDEPINAGDLYEEYADWEYAP